MGDRNSLLYNHPANFKNDDRVVNSDASGAGGKDDVGYGIRDWHDLDGTKYGKGKQLARACRALNARGVQVYHDQVHNHLMECMDKEYRFVPPKEAIAPLSAMSKKKYLH